MSRFLIGLLLLVISNITHANIFLCEGKFLEKNSCVSPGLVKTQGAVFCDSIYYGHDETLGKIREGDLKNYFTSFYNFVSGQKNYNKITELFYDRKYDEQHVSMNEASVQIATGATEKLGEKIMEADDIGSKLLGAYVAIVGRGVNTVLSQSQERSMHRDDCIDLYYSTCINNYPKNTPKCAQ